MPANGARPPRWHGRWAKNTAIAVAPLCALVALLVVGARTREAVPALQAYAAGAVAGALAGALLGGLAGAVRLRVEQLRARRQRRRTTLADEPTWVLHRSTAAAPGRRLVHR